MNWLNCWEPDGAGGVVAGLDLLDLLDLMLLLTLPRAD